MDLPVRWFVVVPSARLRGECESEKFNKITGKQSSQRNVQSDGASAAVTLFDGGKDFCCKSLSVSGLLKLSAGVYSEKEPRSVPSLPWSVESHWWTIQ